MCTCCQPRNGFTVYLTLAYLILVDDESRVGRSLLTLYVFHAFKLLTGP